MEGKERNKSKKFNLSNMNDDELQEFMDSVETDESDSGDFSSGDEFNDPDYIPDEISAEEEQCISQAIREMNAGETSDFFIQAVNMSLNVYDLPPASSTIIETVAATETVETTEAIASTSQAMETLEIAEETETVESTTSHFKPQKRPRSPLPSIEITGPDIVPSAGGFIGAGILLIIRINEFKNTLFFSFFRHT